MPSLRHVIITAIFLPACLGDGGEDRADSADVFEVADGDEGDGTQVDGVEDAEDAADVADVADTAPLEPVACDPDEACTDLLDDDGRCAAACVTVRGATTCRGAVRDHVCHAGAVGERPDPDEIALKDYPGVTVRLAQRPRETVVGASHPLEMQLVNASGADVTLSFSWRNPEVWTFAAPSWDGVDSLTVPAGATTSLTATITAASPTVFSAGAPLIATFYVAGVAIEPLATVGFAPGAGIDCGGASFPVTWCDRDPECYSSHSYYYGARCCDGVFFPGATCCADADCLDEPAGACVDGRCVRAVPTFGTANSLPLGNVRAVLVLVDSHPDLAGDPCGDHYDAVREDLGLAAVEAWYDDLAARRLGRDALDIRWTVLAGIATADFLEPGDPNDWWTFSERLDAWLTARGCPLVGAWDKVVVSALTVDLAQFGGRYFGDGMMAVHNPWDSLLVAHELGHSFGADDLYLELGGSLQWAGDLMGNDLTAPPLPGDGVLWGETGFADLDRDGVVDIAQHAAFPDALAVVDPEARITSKGALTISWELGVHEDGQLRRAVVPRCDLGLPDHDIGFLDWTDSHRRKVITLDDTQLDFAALRAAGHLAVRFGATLRTTDRDWQPRTLTLDETRDLPLVDEQR